jgi:hypothetical protein
MKRWDEDTLIYCSTVAMAVFSVWLAWRANDHDAMFYLFSATFLLIHATARRILAAVKKQSREDA